jgi:hypothetical protein
MCEALPESTYMFCGSCRRVPAAVASVLGWNEKERYRLLAWLLVGPLYWMTSLFLVCSPQVVLYNNRCPQTWPPTWDWLPQQDLVGRETSSISFFNTDDYCVDITDVWLVNPKLFRNIIYAEDTKTTGVTKKLTWFRRSKGEKSPYEDRAN